MIKIDGITAAELSALFQLDILDISIDGSNHLILHKRNGGTIDAGLAIDFSAYETRVSAMEALVSSLTYSSWQTLSYEIGIADYGSPYSVGRVRKIGNRVECKGLITTSIATNNQKIFTLPSGYRPLKTTLVPGVSRFVTGPATTGTAHTHNLTSVGMRYSIGADGAVYAYASGNFNTVAWLSLDAIRFFTN